MARGMRKFLFVQTRHIRQITNVSLSRLSFFYRQCKSSKVLHFLSFKALSVFREFACIPGCKDYMCVD